MARIIYDCEIIKMIPDRYEEELEGYEYCSGWEDFKNMGISVIGCCNVDTLEKWFYSDKEIETSIPQYVLNAFCKTQGMVLWGFDSKNFDDYLCQANALKIQSDFDLLELIRLSVFGSAYWGDTPLGWTYELDAIARANGMAKTGSGELAPQLWQDGMHKAVVDYCLNDCEITAKLIQLYLKGALIDPNTGDKLAYPGTPF